MIWYGNILYWNWWRCPCRKRQLRKFAFKFNKKWLLDSLQDIHFKIIDSIDFTSANKNDEVQGCYFYIKPLKHGFKSKLAGEPPEDNIIIIKRSYLKNKELDEILIHELYHYVDRLTKYKYDTIDSFLDKRALVDDKYSLNKLVNIITANNYNYDDTILDSAMKKYILDLYNGYKDDRKYLTSKDEVFARWHSFKSELLKAGYINNIDEVPSKEDIYKFMWIDKRMDDQFITLLLVLDWNKFNEIDK